MTRVVIKYLAEQQELLPTLKTWFEAEWPDYYGSNGKGCAERDLRAYANRGGVPVGLVALQGARPCGFAALKAEAFPSYSDLFPWAGAAYVQPGLRRQGIGRVLLAALEGEARALGYPSIYCATATSVSLLQRCGWSLLDEVRHEGQQLSVFEKPLAL